MSSLVIPVTGGVGPVITGGVGSHIERVIDRITSAVLWDLNDPTGTNNPYGLRTRIRSFNLGTVERRQEFLEPDSPIDQLIYGREGRTRAEWIIRCSATSYDNLRLSLDRLQLLLSSNQVMLHQPDGQAEPLYLDTLPAPQITPLLRGQGLALERLVLRKFEDIEYMVVVWRQAGLRSPERDPTVNKATNPLLLVDVGGDGRPDGWEWSSTTGLSAESIDAATETYKFTRASASTVDFRETAANADTAAPGDVWSGQIKARVSSGASGRARAIVEFLSAANAVLQTDLGLLTALGTDEELLTVISAAAPASTAKVRVGIRWENSDANPNICHTRDPQVEKAAAPTTHRTGEQLATVDSTQGLSGMLLRNPGSLKSPYIITAKFPDSSSKVVELLLAMRSSEGLDGNKRIADLVGETGWADLAADARGWDVASDENNTTSIDDSANGSVGNAARVDGASANVGVMLRRRRITRTTKLDSLRGWEYVWLRLRTSAASEWEVQLRFSRSLADPASVTRLAVTHDTSDASAFGYVEIPLGFIDLPEDPTVSLAGVALEIWARRISAVSGSPHLYMDFTRHLPATPGKDVLTKVVVPAGGEERWLGRELVTPTNPAGLTAGSVVGDDLILTDDPTDAGGTPPSAGFAWPVGRHRVSFDIYRASAGSSLDYSVRVRNVTDSTTPANLSVVNVPSGLAQHTLEFDTVAGKSYQPQVVIDGGGIELRIRAITHEFVPAIGQNETLRADPLRHAAEKLEADGDVISTLAQKGPVPFWIPPGLAAVCAVPLDAARAGYNEPESVKARTLTLSGKGTPRHLL